MMLHWLNKTLEKLSEFLVTRTGRLSFFLVIPFVANFIL